MRINQRWTPEVLVWPASVSLLTLLPLHQDNSLASFFITEGQKRICTEGSKGNQGPWGDDRSNKRNFSQEITKITKGIGFLGPINCSIDWFPFCTGDLACGSGLDSGGQRRPMNFFIGVAKTAKAARTLHTQTRIFLRVDRSIQ